MKYVLNNDGIKLEIKNRREKEKGNPQVIGNQKTCLNNSRIKVEITREAGKVLQTE